MSKTRHVGAGVPADRIPYRNPHEPEPTAEQKLRQRTAALMAAMRGVPGNHVAAALNLQTPGINWFGCSKAHIAHSIARAREQVTNDRSLARVNVAELLAAAKARAVGDDGWRQAAQEQTPPAPSAQEPTEPHPFAVGTILRYGSGSTALMRVDTVSLNHGAKGAHRYYGTQCFGGSVGAYHDDCSPASSDDLEEWAAKSVRRLAAQEPKGGAS